MSSVNQYTITDTLSIERMGRYRRSAPILDADHAKAVDEAWLLNKYFDLVPDKRKEFGKYIPGGVTPQEMEQTQKAIDYRRGWYPNDRIINDAEDLLEEKGAIKLGWAENFTHAWRYVSGLGDQGQQLKKTVGTYFNPAYSGKDFNDRAEVVRDRSFVGSIYDAYNNQTNPNYAPKTIAEENANAEAGKPKDAAPQPKPTIGKQNNSGAGFGLGQVTDQNGDLNPFTLADKAAESLWEMLKKKVAKIPATVDVLMILGGVAGAYFGSYLPSPGSFYVIVPSVLAVIMGASFLYIQQTITNSALDSTNSAPGKPKRKARDLDYMGNQTLKLPKIRD